MNKTQFINEMKLNIKPYALPRGINERSKTELMKIYNEAQRLGLTNQTVSDSR